ncbi:MAG: nitroreductase family protein [Phycisphaerales bacterium]|nr:nitroreductase family protein [Phycisphaerales bacterium]
MPDPATSDHHPDGPDRKKAQWIPLDRYTPDGSALDAATGFHSTIAKRRTVRHFSDQPVPREVIEQILLAAGTAPSGAHKQPWRFIAVSNPEIKHKIRVAVEEVEKEFYEDRASNRWLEDLEPFETNPDKSYIDTVPWLIIVMALRTTDDGGQVYYLNESVGIATGMLLTAAHHAGLATLTHTPSPMKFLREVLDRPEHERPYMMIPMGYPADDCKVPDIKRKALDDLSVFIE